MIKLPMTAEQKTAAKRDKIGICMCVFFLLIGIGIMTREKTPDTPREIADIKCYAKYYNSAQYDYRRARTDIMEFDGHFSVQIDGEMLNGFGVWGKKSAICNYNKAQKKITAFEFI